MVLEMKSIIQSNIICPNCGHVYSGHTNFYGKICMYCTHFIPPQEEDYRGLSTTERTRRQRKKESVRELKERAIKSILKREAEEKKNEYSCG